ncbi:hypothetical protein [Actinophytocola sp.]|uniref:hypothetical protein n=1 Tax=Actinophytocola sp. TaxID=1872138 RepID=UPI003D6C1193
MSWETTRRRYRLVHSVLDEVARTGRPEVPPRLRARVDAEFGDFGGFLQEVRRRWNRSLEARLDGFDPAGEVWRELARDLPATRLLLDTYADHPALGERRAIA